MEWNSVLPVATVMWEYTPLSGSAFTAKNFFRKKSSAGLGSSFGPNGEKVED